MSARRGAARGLLVVALVLVVSAVTYAHASLVRSSPARRAVLLRPPDRVSLWFNERLEPAFSRITVTDAAGASVQQGEAGVVPDDPVRLSVGLRPLPAGTYTVRYRVLSVDGHAVEGEFPFTLRGP